MSNECLVVICGGAPAILSWTPDNDYALVGAQFSANYNVGSAALLMSNDPQVLVSDLIANQQVKDHVIAFFSSTYIAPLAYTPLSWEARKGQTIYFSATGASFFALYYTSPEGDHVV